MNKKIFKIWTLLMALALLTSSVSCHSLKRNRYDRCSHFSKGNTPTSVIAKKHG